MKRYTLGFIVLLLFFAATYIFAIDYSHWVLNSDRTANSVILHILSTVELETQSIICKALGQRQDLAMDSIISSLLELKTPGCHTELLLEILLQSLFTTEYDIEKIELWISLNPVAFPDLVKHMRTFKNENLKTHIIHLLQFTENQVDTKQYLMVEAQNILQTVMNQRGRLTFYQKKELIMVLNTINWWENKDFIEFCLSISEICIDKELVKKARELVKKLK